MKFGSQNLDDQQKYLHAYCDSLSTTEMKRSLNNNGLELQYFVDVKYWALPHLPMSDGVNLTRFTNNVIKWAVTHSSDTKMYLLTSVNTVKYLFKVYQSFLQLIFWLC